MERVLFGLAIAGYLAVAFAWPTWRVWRRHGVCPIVFHREAAPVQRLLGLLLGALLALLVAAGGLFAVLGPDALGAWRWPPVTRLGGWLLMVFGTACTVVAQRQMGAAWRVGIDDRPTALVTHGLFRLCRNPIFSGLLAFVAGVAAVCPAWWSIAGLLLTVAALRVQVIFEEGHLAAAHGVAYAAYAARTGRFLPLIGRLRPPQSASPVGS